MFFINKNVKTECVKTKRKNADHHENSLVGFSFKHGTFHHDFKQLQR